MATAGKGFFGTIWTKIKTFVSWVRARIKTVLDWVSDLWTDVNKKADVRIILANAAAIFDGMIIMGFIKKIPTLKFTAGIFYLIVIFGIGALSFFLYRISKDALDGKK